MYKILQLGMIGFRDHPIKQILIYILFTTNSSGAEPTLADKTVDMKACVTVGKSGACSCDMEIDIQVRNCSSYLVYNLSSTPSCPQRYCFGIQISIISLFFSLSLSPFSLSHFSLITKQILMYLTYSKPFFNRKHGKMS